MRHMPDRRALSQQRTQTFLVPGPPWASMGTDLKALAPYTGGALRTRRQGETDARGLLRGARRGWGGSSSSSPNGASTTKASSPRFDRSRLKLARAPRVLGCAGKLDRTTPLRSAMPLHEPPLERPRERWRHRAPERCHNRQRWPLAPPARHLQLRRFAIGAARCTKKPR